MATPDPRLPADEMVIVQVAIRGPGAGLAAAILAETFVDDVSNHAFPFYVDDLEFDDGTPVDPFALQVTISTRAPRLEEL